MAARGKYISGMDSSGPARALTEEEQAWLAKRRAFIESLKREAAK